MPCTANRNFPQTLYLRLFQAAALSIWDPTSSYSSDETPYTYNIYEPLYQYHYLKRPYELIPRAAERIVQPVYFDKNENKLGKDADPEEVALSVYEIPLKKGIMYAPHPAFARDAEGRYVNHHLAPEVIDGLRNPLDLPQKGTRELEAEDYVYAIKRMANPRIISPIFGTMANHLPGLNEYAVLVRAEDERLRRGLSPTDRDLPFLDFRKIPLKGVSAPDKYTLRLEVKGKYPQFSNWLAMTFFSPIPWEAEAFYAQKGMAKNNLSLNYWPVGTGPTCWSNRLKTADMSWSATRTTEKRNFIRAKAKRLTSQRAICRTAARRCLLLIELKSARKKKACLCRRNFCRAITILRRSSVWTTVRVF